MFLLKYVRYGRPLGWWPVNWEPNWTNTNTSFLEKKRRPCWANVEPEAHLVPRFLSMQTSIVHSSPIISVFF